MFEYFKAMKVKDMRMEEGSRRSLGVFVVTGNLIRVTVVKTDGTLDNT